MTGAGENFLGRWSRRKQAQQDTEDAPAVEDTEDGEATAPDAEDGDNAAIDPADLPDIDSLGKDSDFTVFMQDGVPEALRNRALRKLWTTDPVLANLDGLNDYEEDFGAIMRVGAAAMRRIAAEEARKAATVAKADDIEQGGTEPDDTEPDDTKPDDRGSPESRSESAENIADSSRETEPSGADEEDSADDEPTGRA
jgi:hypothetical protein